MLRRLPEWKKGILRTRAGRTKTAKRTFRKGKRGRGVERKTCLEN